MYVPKEVADAFNNTEVAPYANMTKADCDKIKKAIAGWQKKISQYNEKIIGARAVMKTVCIHENKTIDKSYSEGGYDYKATTTYRVICTDCDDVLYKHTEISGGYA